MFCGSIVPIPTFPLELTYIILVPLLLSISNSPSDATEPDICTFATGEAVPTPSLLKVIRELLIINEPDTVNPPFISTLVDGVAVPIPILLPLITKSLLPYFPATKRSSENTSRIGIPEISFTENKEPLNESSIWNSVPCVPSTRNLAKLDVLYDLIISSLPVSVYKDDEKVELPELNVILPESGVIFMNVGISSSSYCFVYKYKYTNFYKLNLFFKE